MGEVPCMTIKVTAVNFLPPSDDPMTLTSTGDAGCLALYLNIAFLRFDVSPDFRIKPGTSFSFREVDRHSL